MSDLAALGVAALADGGAAVMSDELRPLWPEARVHGPAVTVVCGAGDNLAMQVAAAEAHPGCVIVCDALASPSFGYWGEVLVVQAMARGIAGLVIAGGVRDVEATVARRFPVWASHVSARGCTKLGPGRWGGSVVVGGVTVSPGDTVVADRDGVAVIEASRLAEVTASAREKVAKEEAWFRAIEMEGKTTIDLYGFDTRQVERIDL